ncbi:MAG: hypothetical protein KDE27_20130 [Planctomycetes bacterium]|nr:hypothetical protein [Planctomycetota bacterium]
MSENKQNGSEDHAGRPGVLRRSTVRVLEHPALVECGGNGPAEDRRAISVVPLLDGSRVAGFEVRCGCGSTAIVECVYTNEVPQ